MKLHFTQDTDLAKTKWLQIVTMDLLGRFYFINKYIYVFYF